MKAKLSIFLLSAATSLLILPPSFACSTCQCGDPTLSVHGTEKPFAGRTRFSADFRHRTENTGSANVNRRNLEETRFTLSGSYSPTEWASLGLSVPFLRKNLERTNGASDETFGLGDMEVSAKVFLLGPRQKSKRNLFGFTIGSRLPSGPEHRRSDGSRIDFDAQSGTGAFVPQAGLWYGRFQFPWLIYASTTGHFPTEGRESFEAGESITTTLMSQYHINRKWAAQLSADTRWSRKDFENGEVDTNSGGFIAFLSPGLMYSPAQDFIIRASVQVPAVNALNGDHSEGFNFLGGITYDL